MANSSYAPNRCGYRLARVLWPKAVTITTVRCPRAAGRSQPITQANPLPLVFKEVLNSKRGKRLPAQLLYSNAVHEAEGPTSPAAPGVGGRRGWRFIRLVFQDEGRRWDRGDHANE
jgi:hypothetical protein